MKIDIFTKIFFPLLFMMLYFVAIVSTYLNIIPKFGVIFSYSIFLLLAYCAFKTYINNKTILRTKMKSAYWLYRLLLVYVVVAFVKQLFVPSGIFPFQRMLVLCSFICLGSIFIFSDNQILERIHKLWWKVIPAVFLIIFLFIWEGHYQSITYLSFFYVLILDVLSRKQRLFVFLSIALMLFGIFQRMEYIQIAGPVMIFLFSSTKWINNNKLCRFIFHACMLLPVVLFLLAVTGNFNVFDFDSYVKGDYISISGENMKDDTRTFLYEESIASAITNNYVLLGRTPAYGYDTPWFLINGGENHSWNEVKDLFPQRNSEVFVVNMFTWTGLLGLIAWFIFIYHLGLFALKRSRNKYINSFVLFIGFFWICLWINYPFDYPNATFMLFFMVVAYCMKGELQKMNNNQMIIYLKNQISTNGKYKN